jgi:hypothetical protein
MEHTFEALKHTVLEMLEGKLNWHVQALAAAKKIADLEAEIATLKAAAKAEADKKPAGAVKST